MNSPNAQQLWRPQQQLDANQYRSLAAQGDANAQYMLAMCLKLSSRDASVLREAAEWLQKASHQGHPQAQYNLGVCYGKGKGVPRNPETSLYWYQQAANQGLPEAQASVGWCFKHGKGVAPDDTVAMSWYQKAAHQGHAASQYEMGLHCQNNIRDPQQALGWFQKAAEQGHPQAQYSLGVCYGKGKGVQRNQETSMYWYQQAASQGLPEAQASVGWCLKRGKGVAQPDNKTAMSWYQKAAHQGHAASEYEMGLHCQSQTHDPESQKQALGWFQKAAEQGFAPAQNSLGVYYWKGFGGVPLDAAKALELFSKSELQGDRHAKKNLASLMQELDTKYQQNNNTRDPNVLRGVAYCLHHGLGGIPPDQQRATELLLSAQTLSQEQKQSPPISRQQDNSFNCTYFLSHSGKNKAIALCVARLLEQYQQSCWLDVLDCRDHNQTIYKAIEKCSCFVAILSASYFESKWCLKELGFAEGIQKRIVCLRVEKPPNPNDDMYLKSHPGTSTRGTDLSSEVYELFAKFLNLDLSQQDLENFRRWIVQLRDVELQRALEYKEMCDFVGLRPL